MCRGVSSEETERSCTIWDATSFTTRAAMQGSNRKERWLSRRLQLRSSRNHGSTWTHGGHPGLPHMRLEFTVVDAGSSSLLLGHEEGKSRRRLQHKQRKRRKTNMENDRRVGVTGIAVQLSVRFWPRTGYAPPQAGRIQTSDHQSSGKRQWTAPTGMAKTPERLRWPDTPLQQSSRPQGIRP